MTHCHYCGRRAEDIDEYVDMAHEENISPEEFAKTDGTYNPDNDVFCCTSCYITLGMPSAEYPNRWRAGDNISPTM